MKPPILTEAWSVGYLQALIMLLVFALGVPAVIYQITSENIRYIINRYMKTVLLAIIGIDISIIFFALCFVWFLHPTPPPSFSCQELWASYLITMALLIAPLIWFVVQLKFLREKVVAFLKNKIEKQFKKDGSLGYNETIDMITLGERSDAGFEKVVVLNALDDLMGKIQNSERYQGSYLDLILKHYDKIVTGIAKPGNESDFVLTVNILEKIIGRFSDTKFPSFGDEILVYRSLTEIGKKAAELRFAKVTQMIVQIAASNSDALFKIGLYAFTTDDYYAATTALSTLKNLALTQETSKEKRQCANDLFGLLAHFWTGNKGAHRCAEEFLETFGNKFSPLEEYLDQAIEDHYSVSRFDTADKLMTMRDEIMKNKRQ